MSKTISEVPTRLLLIMYTSVCVCVSLSASLITSVILLRYCQSIPNDVPYNLRVDRIRN